MAGIKTIIWDFEGVVLLPQKGSFSSTLAARLGVNASDLERAMQSDMVRKWDIDEIDDITFYTYLLNEIRQPLEKISIIQRSASEDFYIDQEILDKIKLFRKKYTSILLTNFPGRFNELIKTHWIIDGAFDHIIASCDVKLVKPDPAIYQLALDRAECLPQESVFIDDREENLHAAENLGIKVILYQNLVQALQSLEKILTN